MSPPRAPTVRDSVPDLLTAVAVCIAATVAYGLWQGAAYSGDDLQFAGLIREAVTGPPSFHPAGSRFIDPLTLAPTQHVQSPRWVAGPRYPLDTLAAIAWARVRGDEDPIAAVQALRALCGGLTLLFAFLGLRRLAVTRATALVTTMSLGLSHAFWDASTRVDYAITAALMVSLTIFVFAGWLSHPRRLPPPLGMVAWLAVAALCNLLALLPAVALLGAGFVASPTRNRLFALIGRVALLALLVGGALAGFGLLVPSGGPDAPFWRQLTQGGVGLDDFQPVRDGGRAAAGLARAVLALPGLGDEPHGEFWRAASVTRRAMLVASYVGVWVMALALLVAPWLPRAGLGARRPAAVALVVSVLALSAFNWVWDPGYLKFWVLPVTLWWLLLALVLEAAIGSKLETRRWLLAVAALGVILGAVNWAGHFRPAADPSRQPWLTVARLLSATPRSTLFLSAGHLVDFHIVYFARRNVVSTELVRYDAAIGGRPFRPASSRNTCGCTARPVAPS